MPFGKVNNAFVYSFAAKTAAGAARTGIAPASFAVQVRNPGNTATSNPAVSEVAGGMYRFTIPASFTNTHGAGEYGISIEITAAPFDTAGDTVAFFVNDLDDLSTAAALAIVQADTDDIQSRLPATLSSGRMRSQVEGMDASTVTAAVIATDAIDADAVSADAVAEIQSGLATAATQALHTAALIAINADTDDIQGRLPVSLSGGRMRSQVEGLDADTITSSAIATDAIDAAALDVTAIAEIQSGLATAATQAAHTAALAAIQADTDDVQARLPATLTGGRMRSHVEAFDADVIDAAAIAVDAIDASSLAADAVAEIQSGLSTAVAVAAIQADTDDIQTRLPASLSSGRMRSQVEGMDPATITATSVATDAIDADAIAADAVAEVQFGLATAATQAIHTAALAVLNADTDDIQARLPATLSAGRMRSQTEGVDANAITAAAIATDAIDADAIANDAVSEIASEVDAVLTAAHGPGSWGVDAEISYIEVRQGWSRNVTAGDRLRGIVHLEVDGQRQALPVTARLELQIRSRGDSLLQSVSGLVPVGGEFSHEFDPLTFAIPSGDVLKFRAIVTLSGVGSGTHIGQLEVSFSDFTA
jgi:hypothetical protein